MQVIDTSGMSREQWLALRRESIGASDAPVIAGLSRYKSRFGLWLEKTGQSEPELAGEQAWFGTRLEDVICARLNDWDDSAGFEFCGIQRRQVMVVDDDYPWLTSTLDAIEDSDPERVWEFKAAGIGTAKGFENGNPATLPDSWICQAHHQMLVADVREIHFAVFVGHRLQLYQFVVGWDDAIGEGLIQLLTEFRRHVETVTPPAEFDAMDAALLLKHYRDVEDDIIVTEDDRLLAMSRQYEAAKAAADFQSELADQLKAGLLARMTTACGMRCGPYLMKRSKVNVKAQEPKPRAAYSYTKFTFTNTESDE